MGLAVPALIARIHGERAALADPTKGGLGGTLGYGLFGSPLAGIAYGQGHAAGREKAKNAAIANLQKMGALGAGVLMQGGQISYPNAQAAQSAMQLIQNPQLMNPYNLQLNIQ